MIDPTTNLGKLRLRCGDTSDLPMMPDVVYLQTLTDNSNNLPAAARIVATYILGSLTSRTHRKLASMEVFGNLYYTQYRDYLMLIVTNPNFMDLSPIPVDLSDGQLHPLLQFQKDWNLNYSITQSQQLNWTAFGNVGSFDGSWSWPG